MKREINLICFIFVARSDAGFIAKSLPPLLKMSNQANCKIKVILDATSPKGVLGRTLPHSDLTDIIKKLKAIQSHHSFEIDIFSPKTNEVYDLAITHFGSAFKETHCFRGYPIFGSFKQFTDTSSKYLLHLDCDMIFYEDPNFSWIQEGMRIMEENEDILCVLPKGGPPTKDGTLHQGTTEYQTDKKRELFLFKNFTSRHYLIHKQRFMSLLPLKPLWLSWREPIKSRVLGKGKMLCWESMVGEALENSNLWRADLMTDQAWSIHPGDRTAEFYKLLPKIIKSVSRNDFPDEQRGHFDLRLDDWNAYLN